MLSSHCRLDWWEKSIVSTVDREREKSGIICKLSQWQEVRIWNMTHQRICRGSGGGYGWREKGLWMVPLCVFFLNDSTYLSCLGTFKQTKWRGSDHFGPRGIYCTLHINHTKRVSQCQGTMPCDVWPYLALALYIDRALCLWNMRWHAPWHAPPPPTHVLALYCLWDPDNCLHTLLVSPILLSISFTRFTSTYCNPIPPVLPTSSFLRPNSWTKSRQKSQEFSSLLFTVTSAAMPYDFCFFKLMQPLTVSMVQLLYTLKEKGRKPDRKP